MNHAATLSPAVPRPAHVPDAALSPKAMLALEDGIRTLRWDA